jgi:methionine synthase I (cobalamin-dependent)/5,10-methylenetetrahydrofolate reductase
MNRNLLDWLAEKKVLLFDGAMGTLLYSRGIFINRCFDELNLSAPDLVRECHREYVQAGADIIETNTFGANRIKLLGHGVEAHLRDINLHGAMLAREAAGDHALVAGSVGPLGIKIEPWGPTSVEEARELFAEQISALVEGGVDLIVLETFGDLNEVHQALAAAKQVCELPVVAHMTLQEDGNSLYGTAPELFGRRLEEWGAAMVGVNCSVGPEVALQAVERILAVVKCPVVAQPNAGVPRAVEGRNIYLASPEYFEEYAKRFLQVGARAIGGCCGTTPDHIRAMRKAVYAFAPEARERHVERPTLELSPEEAAIEESPIEARSNLGAKLARGEFVTSIELVPPRGHTLRRVLARAQKARDAGIDLINIPDGPRASARMSPLAMAVRIQQELGMETLLHYTCRDRNLLGMQSDLLGAFALGLKNLLLITGDPPKMGDYPDATAVFDVDAIGLTNMVTRLNHGLDLGGNSIGKPTEFVVGVGVNPGAINLEYELRRFYWKVDAGAHFAITQPVFDVALLEQLLETLEKRDLRIPVVAGIWPLLSLRNAEFMNNEVPGASVPDPIMARIAEAQQKGGDHARHVGVEIARETFERIRPLVQGIQVSPPMGRVELALEVIGLGQEA